MPLPRVRRSLPPTLAALALIAVVGSAAQPMAVAAASPEVTSTGLPIPPAAPAAGPSVLLAEQDPTVRDAFSGVALLDYDATCSAALVLPGSGEVPADAPAYALTNGHCAGMFDGTTVIRDQITEPSETDHLRFGVRDDGTPVATAGVAAIRWATMKGTDLAILELDTPLVDLMAQGVRPYLIGEAPSAGTDVVVVGGPATPDGSDRALRLARCTIDGSSDLLERHWTWFAFPSNDCADIRPGSSGSPVLDPATGRLVGLINTTTQGSAGVSDCILGRPCEVHPDGVRSREDTSYGPTLAAVGGCFDTGGSFTGPSASCALDPGDGIVATTWTLSANPGTTPVSGGMASPSTWGVELEPSSGQTHLRTAIGPAGGIDCRDPTVYGPPEPIADPPFLDPPLPDASGHALMCLIGGSGAGADATWQSIEFPTVLNTDVDRTPPLAPIELAVMTMDDGWSVEPLFVVQELSLFDWKWGPPDATDCDDPAGYSFYRRFPATLLFEEAPIRLCVIGYDDATNRTPALDRLFEAP